MGSSLSFSTEEYVALIIIGDAKNTTAMRIVAARSIERRVFSGML